MRQGYNGNPNLPRIDYVHPFTQSEIDEYLLCAKDPVYFTKKYMKIVHVDKGLIPFDMWDFQEDMINTFHQNRFSICKLPRQVGKCLYIYTRVKIRRKNTVSYLTLGELYEIAKNQAKSNNRRSQQAFRRNDSRDRLCDMQSLRNDEQRALLAYHANPQVEERKLLGKTSLRKSNQRDVREGQIFEESCISAWRQTISLLQQIFQGNGKRRVNEKESESEQTTSQKRYDEIGILVREDGRKRRESERDVVEEAINILALKLCHEARRRSGPGNLVEKTREMVEELQKNELFKSFSRTFCGSNESLCFEHSIFRDMESREHVGIHQQRISSETLRWIECVARLHRHRKEEDYRVRWNLLAQSGKIESPERTRKRRSNSSRWISDVENCGERLQSKLTTLHPDLSKLSDIVERKFIDSLDLQDFEIQTDTGWQPVSSIHKTVLYDEWILKTNNHDLICADTHIVFRENYEEVFVQDLVAGDRIITESGIETVVSVEKTDRQSHMFDITVDSDDHRFYSNGILSHNTTTSVAFILHSVLFNENYNVAILANKASTAREIVGRLQLAFEYLPRFLQQGVVEWNKGNIVLANGSKVQADSTSGSSVRGRSYSMIFLDEFAHVPTSVAEPFFMSTYPTISSGQNTKVIIVSTPNGLNLFYKMWMDAIEKRSEYLPVEIHWSMVPGRDEAWKEQTIKNTSQEQFDQEFECNFIGSTNTLIHPNKLRTLAMTPPIEKIDNFDIYEHPKNDRTYVISVDVAEGQGLDYSTFAVIDVTQIPYRMVGKYRNNKIAPLLYPTVIYQVAQKYNEAFILVEINSIGLQVADILHNELAYENLVKIQPKGKHGQQMTPGFTKKMQMGLRQSAQTKKIGCANLKSLIENDKLIITDPETIMELTTFSANKASYAAEEGNNDDLVMTLVNFGWLTAQRYFKENVQNDIRKVLQEEQFNIMDQDLVPFGFIDDGINNNFERDADGDLWIEDRKKQYPFDNFAYNWREKL